MCPHDLQAHFWEDNLLLTVCLECNRILHDEQPAFQPLDPDHWIDLDRHVLDLPPPF